jgi:hypothetical protein
MFKGSSKFNVIDKVVEVKSDTVHEKFYLLTSDPYPGTKVIFNTDEFMAEILLGTTKSSEKPIVARPILYILIK